MIVGLIAIDGAHVRFDSIDPVQHAERFGVSPATLAYLKHDAVRRGHLPADGITASQWGNGLRQRYLEMTAEVFVEPHGSIAALMGTAKHAHILTEGLEKRGIRTEVRLYAPAEPRISGQADQVVQLGGGKVQIWDAKTGKKYSLKMYRAEIETHRYTYQMNLLADLYRMENRGAIVEKLAIEWLPSDAGRGDPSLEIVDVPMWDHGKAFDAYRASMKELDAHLAAGTVPLVCTEEERWERYDKKAGGPVPLRCLEYCPLLDICKATSAKLGEPHPTDPRR